MLGRFWGFKRGRTMFQLLGTPRIIDQSGKPLKGFPAKAFVLVAYLETCPGRRASRAEIADLLWDGDEDKAGQALRRMLSNAHKAEPDGMRTFGADRKDIWLTEQVETDAGVVVADSSFTPERVIERLRCEQHELLKGLYPRSAAAQEWLEEERRSRRERLIDQVKETAPSWTSEERRKVFLQALDVDPYDEELFRTYAADLAALGQLTRLQVEWDRFTERLRRDLDTLPSPETQVHLSNLLGEARVRSGIIIGTQYDVPATTGLSVTARRPRLIVLAPPFDEVNATIAERGVARSFMEDITDALTGLRSFEVLAPHTARQLSSIHDEAAQDAGAYADYVIETHLAGRAITGSAGELTIRLTESATGRRLFAERLSFDIRHLPHHRQALLVTIVQNLVSQIDRTELNRFRTAGDASAYTFFLLGKDKLQPFDLKSVKTNQKLFERSLKLDGSFLPSRAMISRTLTQEWFLLARPESELLDRAAEAAEEVMEREPLYAAGFWEMSNARLYLGDIDGAVEHAERARLVAPNHADIVSTHADTLVHACDFHRANAEIDRAMELNPLAPDEYRWIKASCLFHLDLHKAALDEIKLAGSWQATARLRAACHALLGNSSEAERWRVRYLNEYPDFSLANWSKVVPLKSAESREKYTDALRLAGFA